VDWYPWGEEAFQVARTQNKLIFLSIGYSTCHWCHVMEVESFEDEDVAALMNDAFVSIKVDREERPDIDNIYMTVAMMMNGSGGWPLTIIMTPDQKPVLAATYLPKRSRFQLTGMLDLAPRIQQLWQTEPEKILDTADQVSAALLKTTNKHSEASLDRSVMEAAYQTLSNSFDPEYGGFGQAPKFPTPHILLFLLRHWYRNSDPHALDMVETTLKTIRAGGIYDHLGYGFHRYSTDREWFAPHFEKMLYDQALLAMAYTEAYLVTGKQEYESTTREVIDYVLRVMRDPLGGFYTAEDADSEGVEGKFYLWAESEIRELLSDPDAEYVIQAFNVQTEGNFNPHETNGENILHLKDGAELDNSRWEPIREALFSAREERIKPYKDDKVLTDWNGLMIAALAKAAQAFDEPVYADAATRAADFILTSMRSENGRLSHRFRQGEAGIDANLNDYAYLIWGLLELYEATFETGYLAVAIELQECSLEHFWDAENGGFFLTADDSEKLLIRPKDINDSATPSGNSVAMLNLLRLGRITAETRYEEIAAQIGKAFAHVVKRYPSGFSLLLSALDFALGPTQEIVIAGDPSAADTQAMLAELRSIYLPNKVVLVRPPGERPAINELSAFTAPMTSINGQATAYICRDYVCERPVTQVVEMVELLKKGLENR